MTRLSPVPHTCWRILWGMTTEELIIAGVRVAGALLVLRWAFAGSLLAIAIDFSDLFMMNLLDLGGVQQLPGSRQVAGPRVHGDVPLGGVALAGPVRTIALALFGYRMVGVLAFEALGSREVLLAFPNVFEFWFVFVAGAHRFAPGYEFTMRRSLLWLVPVTLLKEFQEYALHGAQWLDNYRAVDVVVDIWRWVRRLR